MDAYLFVFDNKIFEYLNMFKYLRGVVIKFFIYLIKNYKYY